MGNIDYGIVEKEVYFLMFNSEILNDLLTYDNDTGFLYWKERDIKYFTEYKYQKIWNDEFAYERAFMTTDEKGYYSGYILGKKKLSHRIIWQMHNDEVPDIIDHIDGNRKNNVLNNLRNVDVGENNRNMKLRSDNRYGQVGIRASGKKWRAFIYHNKKEINLGSFGNIEDAIEARLNAQISLGYHENHGKR